MCDKWFHLTDFLRCLRPVKSFEQVGLSCEPEPDDVVVCIVCGWKFEGVCHCAEGFSIGVFRVEPAEMLFQIRIRFQAFAIQLQRGVLAHLLYILKLAVFKRSGHRIVVADVGVRTHEALHVDTFRNGNQRGRRAVLAPQGISFFLSHHFVINDFTLTSAVFVNNGVQSDILLFTGEEKCH